MKSTKWYIIFSTSKLLRECHKEFLETFESEEHFTKWFVKNFLNTVYSNKIVTFIDGVSMAHKKHGASRLATFSCLPETKRLNFWQEIKEAFPFWLYVNNHKLRKIMLAKSAKAIKAATVSGAMAIYFPHINYEAIEDSKKYCVTVYIDSGEIEDVKDMLVRNIPAICEIKVVCSGNYQVGREWPEPISMAPYYVAMVVLAALLILDGFLAHWGIVDYSQILK